MLSWLQGMTDLALLKHRPTRLGVSPATAAFTQRRVPINKSVRGFAPMCISFLTMTKTGAPQYQSRDRTMAIGTRRQKMSGSLLLASVAAGDHATGVRRTPTSDLFLSADIGARPYFGGQGAARWSACGKYISQTEDGEANGDET